MANSLGCSTLASLISFVILIFLPVASLYREETYKSMVKQKAECCMGDNAELKRFEDMDDDSFVSLMGRSAAEPKSYKITPMLRRRHIDHILTDLLGQKKGRTFLCPDENQQISQSQFINRGRLRCQRIL